MCPWKTSPAGIGPHSGFTTENWIWNTVLQGPVEKKPPVCFRANIRKVCAEVTVSDIHCDSPANNGLNDGPPEPS